MAERFIEELAIPLGERWVDVGCGTGAITETILRRAEPASVVGVDPSHAFVSFARAHVTDPRVRFAIGDGAALPLADDAADVAVSGLVLNFVPDPVAMLAEMRRVTRPDGSVAVYVWDYADGMAMMRHFWDTAAELHPDAREEDEGSRFQICAPGPLRQTFTDAGLRSIDVHAIAIETVFRDFDDLWAPFLSATGPAPAYVARLPEADREDLGRRLKERLPTESDGSIHLTARAWAVRAGA